jgi:hypothetical protein
MYPWIFWVAFEEPLVSAGHAVGTNDAVVYKSSVGLVCHCSRGSIIAVLGLDPQKVQKSSGHHRPGYISSYIRRLWIFLFQKLRRHVSIALILKDFRVQYLKMKAICSFETSETTCTATPSVTRQKIRTFESVVFGLHCHISYADLVSSFRLSAVSRSLSWRARKLHYQQKRAWTSLTATLIFILSFEDFWLLVPIRYLPQSGSIEQCRRQFIGG